MLNIDLANRCNMMCTPCFANANQSGVVYELTLKDLIKTFNKKTGRSMSRGKKQIIESRHRRATIEEWYKQCGRYKIYGGDRPVELEPAASDENADAAAALKTEVA